MYKNISCILLSVCLLLSLTACKNEAQRVPGTLALAETMEAATETTAEPTEVTTADQLNHQEDHKVTVGFLPTDKSWQYVAIEDQEAAVAAFEKAVSAVYSDEWWIKGDRTLGLQVEYKGEIWEFVESRELVYPLGRVKAEDAAGLYDLCVEAARKAGWKESVKPEQLTGIVSASLRIQAETFPLTDGAALDKLEAMLRSGTYELGGTGCPFTALLDVEVETGEPMTIALATDGCGVWMSEGYHYSFASDNQPLYDLFGITLEFGKPIQ